MIPEQFKQLELLERLTSDHKGIELKALLDEISDGKSKAKRRLDAGVTPDEYKGLNRLLQAFDAAADVLPSLWQSVRQS